VKEATPMLRSLKELLGYRIQATDGRIGDVKDFYFDDAAWTVRYVVVDTGNWMPGRLVLLAPRAVTDEPDRSQRVLPVKLTQEQVQNSPLASTDRPVSRQHEEELHNYYGWPVYWPELAPVGVAPDIPPIPISREQPRPEGDPNLRSATEVTGYNLAASDGEIGHVEDFIVETGYWSIRYLVVDTRNWLPGKKVLMAPAWVAEVSWEEHAVHVELQRSQVKDSPEFDPSQPVNRDYEARLYDYYGRPAYW
jgi:sporulation protein YlmC with PRC-barrel domain